MKTFLKSLYFAIIAALIFTLPALADDFTPDLEKISIEASRDKSGFDAEIAADFGIPIPKINEMRAKNRHEGRRHLYGMRDRKADKETC